MRYETSVDEDIGSLLFDMKQSLARGKRYDPPPRADMPMLPMHEHEYEVGRVFLWVSLSLLIRFLGFCVVFSCLFSFFFSLFCLILFCRILKPYLPLLPHSSSDFLVSHTWYFVPMLICLFSSPVFSFVMLQQMF